MSYSSTIYPTRPVKFNDYIHNKYDIVHKMLYEDALNKYLNDLIEKVICGDFTYNLFEAFNNYFTIYNDRMSLENNENNIIDLDILHQYNINKVFSIEEIERFNIVKNQEYFEDLYSYIQNNEFIMNPLDKLGLKKEYKEKYILYILVNVIFLLFRLKQTIADDFSTLATITNISDFIIRYKNSIYMLDEEETSGILCLEYNGDHANELFIYEDMIKDDFHIGYTIDGKWILDIDDNIDLSDEDIRTRLLVLITKTNYNLWNLLKYNIKDTYLRHHKIIEEKNVEYWQPSKILIIDKIFPYKKQQIDLKPFWNTYQEYKRHKLENIIIEQKEKLQDGVVEEINYVNGTAKVYSKQQNQYYNVDLNCVKDNTEINDELLNGTFAYMLKNERKQNYID